MNEEVKENSSDENQDIINISETIKNIINRRSQETKNNEKNVKADQPYYSINFMNEYWNNYKTQPCMRFVNGLSCPCPVMCPGYHNAQDRRRNPSTHYYSKVACRNVKCRKSKVWGNYEEKCTDSCPFSHHRFEQMYHPSCFRSVPCLRFPDCDYGDFCSHLHPDHTSVPCIKKNKPNISVPKNKPMTKDNTNPPAKVIPDEQKSGKSIIPCSGYTPLIYNNMNTNVNATEDTTLFPISLNTYSKKMEKPNIQTLNKVVRTSLFNKGNYFESIKENVPPQSKIKDDTQKENFQRFDLNKLLEKIG